MNNREILAEILKREGRDSIKAFLNTIDDDVINKYYEDTYVKK